MERESVDAKFVENLTRDRHLVVFGSSKQGKTSLRKHCLNDNDYITVTCSNKWSLRDLNAAILKSAGYEVTASSTLTSGGDTRIHASLSAKVLGTGLEVGTQNANTGSLATTSHELDLDPA